VAIDTLLVVVGVYGSVDDAKADYELVGDLHTEAGLIDAYAAAVGGGLLVGTTAGGAILGAVAGHAAAGMSRHDLKELGEHLDEGTAGLVVVAVSDMGAKVERAMKRAEKLQQKQLEADMSELEADVSEIERSTAGP